MRTVTVEELEACMSKLADLQGEIVDLPAADYTTDDHLSSVVSHIEDACLFLRRAIKSRISALASARTDAEADKADAKRKDV